MKKLRGGGNSGNACHFLDRILVYSPQYSRTLHLNTRHYNILGCCRWLCFSRSLIQWGETFKTRMLKVNFGTDLKSPEAGDWKIQKLLHFAKHYCCYCYYYYYYCCCCCCCRIRYNKVEV